MDDKEVKKLIVWDLETTGLDPKTCKILEIGAIVCEDGLEPIRLQWVLNHGVDIPEEITRITGITSDIIEAEGREPEQCFIEFWKVLQAADINLTHNGFKFDIPFLAESIRQVLDYDDHAASVLQESLEKSGIDTAVIYKARKLVMTISDGESFKEFADRVMNVRAFGVRYNVGACCDNLNIDRSKVTQHRALGDCELTLEIYRKLKEQPALRSSLA